MESRRVIEEIDWPCEVHRLFRDENRGGPQGIPEAIRWFFQYEAEGIIIEDDCVPSIDFFRFAALMLSRYRDDSRIGAISGNGFVDGPWRNGYGTSIFAGTWGWAAWRRSWDGFDDVMTLWPHLKETGLLSSLFGCDFFAKMYWGQVFDHIYAGARNHWDYKFQLLLWAKSQLCLTPRVNLVRNIGNYQDATHTSVNAKCHSLEAAALAEFDELPVSLAKCHEYDKEISRRVFGCTPLHATLRWIYWKLKFSKLRG